MANSMSLSRHTVYKVFSLVPPLLVCVLLSLPAAESQAQTQAQSAKAKKELEIEPFPKIVAKPALVEFFTSESCKRCKAFLPILAPISTAVDRDVAGLYYLEHRVNGPRSFGSKDFEASEASGERFLEMQEKFGLSRLGFVVVNEVALASGPDYRDIHAGIFAARKKTSINKLDLSVRSSWKPQTRVAEIFYSVSGLGKLRRPYFKLLIFLTENHPEVLDSGEKINRRIVKDVVFRRLSDQHQRGSVDILLPVTFKAENASILAVLSDPGSNTVFDIEEVRDLK